MCQYGAFKRRGVVGRKARQLWSAAWSMAKKLVSAAKRKPPSPEAQEVMNDWVVHSAYRLTKTRDGLCAKTLEPSRAEFKGFCEPYCTENFECKRSPTDKKNERDLQEERAKQADREKQWLQAIEELKLALEKEESIEYRIALDELQKKPPCTASTFKSKRMIELVTRAYWNWLTWLLELTLAGKS